MGKDKQKQPKQLPVQIHIKETNIYAQGKSKVKEVTDTVESTRRVKQNPVDIKMEQENGLSASFEATGDETVGDSKSHEENINGEVDLTHEQSHDVTLDHTHELSGDASVPELEVGGDLSLDTSFKGDVSIDLPKTLVGEISPDIKKVERIHEVVDNNEAFREFQEALKSPGMGIRFETVVTSGDRIVTTYVQKHEEDDSFDQTTTIKEIKKTVGTLPKAKGTIDIRSPGFKVTTPSHEHTGHAELDLPDLPQGSVELTEPSFELDTDSPDKKHKFGGKFGIFGKRKRKDKDDKESDSGSGKIATSDPKHPKWELPKFHLKKHKGGESVNAPDLGDMQVDISGPNVDIDGEFGGKPYPDANIEMDVDISGTDSEQDQVIVYDPNLPDIKYQKDQDNIKMKGEVDIQKPNCDIDINVDGDIENGNNSISKIIHQRFLLDKDKDGGDIDVPGAGAKVEIDSDMPDIEVNVKGKKPKVKKSKNDRRSKEIEKFEIEVKEEGTGTLKRLFNQKFLIGKGDSKPSIDGQADVHVDVPDMDVPDIPSVDINGSGELNVGGSAENLPKLKHKPKQLETENVDWDIKEEASGGFSINLPKFGFGGKKGEYELASEGDLPEQGIKIKGDIDINGKTADTEHPDIATKGEGSGKFGFSLPKFKIGKSKKGSYDVTVDDGFDVPEYPNTNIAVDAGGIDVNKPDMDANVSGDIPSLPEGDIELTGPSLPDVDIDASANVKGPDIDGSMYVDGDLPDGKHKFKFGMPHIKFGGKQGEEENVDVDVKEEGSGGFGFSLPKFKFGGKGKKGELPDGEMSADIDVGDVDVDVKKPDMDADISGDIDINGPEGNMDVNLPDVDVDANIKGPDFDGSPSGKHKFKFGLPKFKFGGKGKKPHIDADIPDSNISGDVDIGDIDGNISGGGDFDIKGPSLPEGDIELKGPSLPDVDIDASANVKGPDIDGSMDVDGDLPDGKHKFKFGMPHIKFGGKQGEEENVDVDVKEEGSGGFGFSLPKFKFGGKGKKGELPDGEMSADIDVGDVDIDVKKPDIDADISGDIDINGPEGNVDVNLPDVDADIEGPDFDGSPSGKHKFKFGLPKFKFGGKGKKPHIDADIPDANISGDVDIGDIDGNISGGGDFDIKGPSLPEGDIELKGPSLPDVDIDASANVKGPDIDGSMDVDGDLPDGKHKFKFGMPHIKFGGKQGEEENVDVDVKEEGSGGFGFSLPKFKFGGKGKKGELPDGEMSADIDVGDVDVDVKKPDMDADISGDIDINGPEGNMDVNLPDVDADANIKGPDFDGSPSGKHKFKFGLPKFKFGGKGKKPHIDADIPNANISGDVDIGDIDGNISGGGDFDIKGPSLPEGDIELKGPSLPDVDIDASANVKGPDIDGSMDVDGDLPDGKHKFKFGMPHIKFGGKQGEEENVDVDVKEEGSGGFGFSLPKFKFGNKDKKGELPDGEISADIDVGDVDIDVKKPDIDADISGDIDINGPEGNVDVNLPDVDADIEGPDFDGSPSGKHKFKFGLPKFKFGGKGKKPHIDADIPDANISGDVDIGDIDGNISGGGDFDIKGPSLPEGDIELKGPSLPDVDIDASANVKGPDIDGSMDVDGDLPDGKHKFKFGMPHIKFGGKQGEEENVDVDVKEEGSGGFGFSLPKFKFGGKGKKGELPDGEMSADIDVGDVDIDVKKPDIDADISGDIDINGPEGNVDVHLPDVDANIEGPDFDGSPSGKHKFKFGLPKFKFGGKGKKPHIDADIPDANISGDVDIGDIDGNISGGGDFYIKGPSLPEGDIELKGPSLPDVDIDASANVKGPDIDGSMDVDGDLPDGKHKFKFGMPHIKFGGKQGEEENVDVDVKEEGSGGFGFSLPKFKFGGKGKKGELPDGEMSADIDVGGVDIDVKKPDIDADISGDIDIKGPERNVDVNLPDVDANIEGPDFDGSPSAKHKFKFGLPKFKFGGKGKKPHIDADIPDANISGDVDIGDIDGNISGGGDFDIKGPSLPEGDIELKGPSLPDVDIDASANVKGPDIDGSMDVDGDLPDGKHKFKFGMPHIKFGGKQGEEENVDVDVKEEGSGGFGFSLPKFKFGGKGKKGELPDGEMSADIDVGGVDIDVKKPDIDADISGDIDINGPEGNVDVNLPDVDVDANIEGPDFDGSPSGKHKFKFGLPKFKFGGKGKKPHIDADIPDANISGEVDIGDIDGNISGGGDFDIKGPSLPEGDIELKGPSLPDVDIDASANVKGPDIDGSMDVDGDLPDGKHKFKFGMPHIKFGGKQGEEENVDVDVKEEGSGGFGFSLPKFKFGGKGKKGELPDGEMSADIDVGGVDIDVKKPDIDADISGDIDINGPEGNVDVNLPDVDVDANIEGPDFDGSPSGKHKFKFGLPKFKFGGKGKKPHIDADIPDANISGDVDIGDIDGNISGGGDFDIKGPSLPEGDIELKGPSLPDVDIDASANVKGPDIDGSMDVDGDLPDGKHKFKFGMPHINFGGKQGEEENVDVDVKEEGSGGFGFSLPRFKFGGKGKKGKLPDGEMSADIDVGNVDIDVNKPDIDADISGDIDINGPDGNVDVNLPDVDVDANIEGPDFDGSPSGKHKFKFGLPKFKFGGKGKKPHIDTEIPDANISGDVDIGDIDGNISGGGDFDIKGPSLPEGDIELKGPSLPDVDIDASANVKGPDIDGSMDVDGDLPDGKHKFKFGMPHIKFGGKQGEEENVDVDVKEEGSGGFGFSLPRFKFGGKGKKGKLPDGEMSADIDVGNVDIDVNKPDIDADISGDIDINGPDGNVDVNLPDVDVDANIEGPDFNGSPSGKHKFKFGLPKFKFGGKGKKPHIDTENPDANISGDVDIGDIDGNISGGGDLDIKGPSLPEGDIELKGPSLPDVDIDTSANVKGPDIDGSMDVDGDLSDGKHKFKFGMPHIKFGGKQGEEENVDVDVKEEGSGGFEFSLPKFKFGGKGKKGELPDGEMSADIGVGDVDIDVKKPDIDADISGDIDINGPEGNVDVNLPDVDANIEGPDFDGSPSRKHKFKFGLPKFKFGGKGKKPHMDAEIPDANISGDVDIGDIDGNISGGGDFDIKGPSLPEGDIELNGPSLPGVDIDASANVKGPDIDGSMDVDGDLPDGKHKFKIGMPHIKFGGKQGEEENVDVDIKEEGSGGFGFSLPKFKFGGKHKQGELPDGEMSAEIDVGGVDIDVKKPDIDADFSGDIDIKGPEGNVDVNVPDVDANINGPDVDGSPSAKHKFKFGLPKFKFGGKGKKPHIDANIPDADISGDVDIGEIDGNISGGGDFDIKGPSLPDGDIELKGPSLPDVDIDASANVKGPDIDGSMDVDGDLPDGKHKFKFGMPHIKFGRKQGEEENVDVDVKEEGSGGFGFSLPRFNFGGKSKKGKLPDGEMSADIDVGGVDVDVQKPDIDADISGDIDIKGPEGNVDVNLPDVDANIDGPDFDGSPSAKHKFKFGLPKFKFGGKGKKPHIDADIPDANISGDVDIGDIDGNISGGGDLDIKGPSLPEGDIELKGPSLPNVDIDASANVKGPDIDGSMDVDGDLPDGKHKFKIGMPHIKFGGKQGEEENVDVDVKEEGSGGFGFSLPRFKFGGKGKKGKLPDGEMSADIDVGDVDIDVKKPEIDADISGDIDINGPEGNVDVNLPDVDVDANIEGPDFDGSPSGKHKFKFGLPKFKFGGKGKKPHIDAEIPDANISSDVDIGDIDGNISGGGDLDIKGPSLPEGDIELKGPSLPDVDIDASANVKGPDIDGSMDVDGDLPDGKHKFKFGMPHIKFGGKQGEEENVDVDVKEEGSGGFGFSLPKFKFGGKGKKGELPHGEMSADIDVGDVDIDVKKPDIDADISGDIDINGPEGNVDVNLPDVDANIEGPDFDGSPSGKHKFKFGLPKFKFGGKGKKPHIDADIPDANISGDVDIGEIDGNISGGGDFDIKGPSLPDGDIKLKGPSLPDVDIDASANVKGPDIDGSMDVDSDLPDGKHKFKIGMPHIEFGGKQGEEENVDVDIKEEGSGGFGFSLPKFKFGGKHKKGELPDGEMSADIDVGGVDVDVKKPVIDADISGDIDIKGPEGNVDVNLPDVDVDANIDGPDFDGSPSGKHKFKFGLPKFKFGGKGKKLHIDADRPDANISGDVDIGDIEGNISGGGDLDIKGPSLPEGDIELKGPSLPDLDIDASTNVKGPDIDGIVDVDGDLPDGKHKFKFGMPHIKFGGKQGEEENVDVDVKEEGSGGFGFSLPKFKFGGKGKKGELPDGEMSADIDVGGVDIDMKKPDIDADISGDIDINGPEGNVDVNLPDVDVDANIEGPDFDGSPSGKHKFKFGLPKFKFGGKGKKPHIDADIPDANISGDVDIGDIDGNISGGGDFDIKGPSLPEGDIELKGPSLPDVDIDASANVKGPDIDGSMDVDGDLPDGKHKFKFGMPHIKFGGKQGEEENVDVDVKEEGSGGFGFSLPKFKFGGKGKKGELPDGEMSADIDVGGVDVDVKKPDIDADISGDIDIKGPEGNVDVNLPGVDVDANINGPDFDGSPSGKHKFKFGLPKFKFGGKGKKPHIDAEIPDANISGDVDIGDIDGNISGGGDLDIKGPSLPEGDLELKGPSLPDLDIDTFAVLPDISAQNDVDINLKTSQPDVDVTLPKSNIDIPDVALNADIEGPSLEISGKDSSRGSSIEKQHKHKFGFPSFHLGGKAEQENVSVEIKEEENSRFGIPRIKFGGRRRHKDSGSSTSGEPPDLSGSVEYELPNIPNSDLNVQGDKVTSIPNIEKKTGSEHLEVNGLNTSVDIPKTDFEVTGPSLSYDSNIQGEINVNGPHVSGDIDRHSDKDISRKFDIHLPKFGFGKTKSRGDSSSISSKGSDHKDGDIHIPQTAASLSIPPPTIESEVDGDIEIKKKKKFGLPWRSRSKSKSPAPGKFDDSVAQLGQTQSKEGKITLATGDRISLSGNVEGDVPDVNFKGDIQLGGKLAVDTNTADISPDQESDPLNNYKFPFENLVLQGKGSDCIAHIGVVKKLNEAGVYSNISRFAGSGMGGLVAALLACGAGLKTLEIWLNNDIPKLVSARTKCLPIGVVRKYGHTPEERIQNWLGQKIKCLLGDPNVTFSQLQSTRNKELTLVVTNASQMRTDVLAPKTTPNLPVKIGVRMCLAYQGMFKPLPYKIGDSEDVYNSGILLDPYPLDSYDKVPDEDSPEQIEENNRTLGVLLQCTKDTKALTREQQIASSHDERPVDVTDPPVDIDASVDPADLASPMLRFLQTLQKHKVDKNVNGISKNDLENMLLQRISLPHDDLKLLFGEKRTADDIFAVIGAKNKNEITYKELLNYFENKLHPHMHHKAGKTSTLGRSKQSGSLGRSKQQKLEAVYISVQEALSATGIQLHVSKQDLDRTIRVDTGDVSEIDMKLEEDDKIYLMQEGERATDEYLRKYVDSKQLSPTAMDGGVDDPITDPDVQFLLTREDVSNMIDEELSEIINEREYMENCSYVGEYT